MKNVVITREEARVLIADLDAKVQDAITTIGQYDGATTVEFLVEPEGCKVVVDWYEGEIRFTLSGYAYDNRDVNSALARTIPEHLGDQHTWICHPGEECEDGCQVAADPDRLEAYRYAESLDLPF